MIAPSKSSVGFLRSSCQARYTNHIVFEEIVVLGYSSGYAPIGGFTSTSYYSPAFNDKITSNLFYYDLYTSANIHSGGSYYAAATNRIKKYDQTNVTMYILPGESCAPYVGTVRAIAWYSQLNTSVGYKFSFIEKFKLHGPISGVISVHDESLPSAGVCTLSAPSSWSTISIGTSSTHEQEIALPASNGRQYYIFWPGVSDLSGISFPIGISASGYDVLIHFRTPVSAVTLDPWSV